MNSLFARLLKVAAPYTLCGALGVVALAGDARAQIAPECRDANFALNMIFEWQGPGQRVQVPKGTVAEAVEQLLPGWVKLYAYKQVALHLKGVSDTTTKPSVVAGAYHALPRLATSAVNNIFSNQVWQGSSATTHPMTKCQVTKKPNGELKSVTVAFKDVSQPSDYSSSNAKGELTATLRPPVREGGLHKYSISRVTYNAERLKKPGSEYAGAATGSIALPPEGAPTYNADKNGGTLIAKMSIKATFQNLRGIANLIKGTGIGGLGWTGNLQSDSNHCGEIAAQAQAYAQQFVRDQGFNNVMVGVVRSDQASYDNALLQVLSNIRAAVMGDMLHAVVVLWIPGEPRALIVDAWDKGQPVIETPIRISRAGGGTWATVNFPKDHRLYRRAGYSGGLIWPDPKNHI